MKITKLPASKKILFFALLFVTCISYAQINAVKDTAYLKVLKDRTAKILLPLSIKKERVYLKVQKQIIDQYYNVNKIHEINKQSIAAIKQQKLSKEIAEKQLQKAEETKRLDLANLHHSFLKKISKKLNTEQIEKVKDGMTYSVLPKTWNAYLDMLQNLTQAQKNQMYAWLIEARELAMDEGTSDQKHAVFGKYKGRINNYLSAQGYDMKKESNDWQERIKKQQLNKTNTTN